MTKRTAQEIKEQAAKQLSTSISLGSWHGMAAGNEVIKLLDELIQLRIKEALK